MLRRETYISWGIKVEEHLGELVPGINHGGAMPGGLSRESTLGIESSSMAMESRGLYIQMEFPNYDKDKSYFEGKVRILNKKTGRKVVVSVSKGKLNPTISDIEGMDSWVLRTSPKLIGKTELGNKDMKLTELYDFNENNIYEVRYKIGEFSGSHDIYYQLKYWPSKIDDPNTSLVLAYPYQEEV